MGFIPFQAIEVFIAGHGRVDPPNHRKSRGDLRRYRSVLLLLLFYCGLQFCERMVDGPMVSH